MGQISSVNYRIQGISYLTILSGKKDGLGVTFKDLKEKNIPQMGERSIFLDEKV
jgi:hypothetical protein